MVKVFALCRKVGNQIATSSAARQLSNGHDKHFGPPVKEARSLPRTDKFYLCFIYIRLKKKEKNRLRILL